MIVVETFKIKIKAATTMMIIIKQMSIIRDNIIKINMMVGAIIKAVLEIMTTEIVVHLVIVMIVAVADVEVKIS